MFHSTFPGTSVAALQESNLSRNLSHTSRRIPKYLFYKESKQWKIHRQEIEELWFPAPYLYLEEVCIRGDFFFIELDSEFYQCPAAEQNNLVYFSKDFTWTCKGSFYTTLFQSAARYSEICVWFFKGSALFFVRRNRILYSHLGPARSYLRSAFQL
jgi:hypothetical protein